MLFLLLLFLLLFFFSSSSFPPLFRLFSASFPPQLQVLSLNTSLIYSYPSISLRSLGCKNSTVFRPPNPWVIGLVRTLKEIYDVPDLKLNLKFEVEVLCKTLNLRLNGMVVGAPSTSLKARYVMVGWSRWYSCVVLVCVVLVCRTRVCRTRVSYSCAFVCSRLRCATFQYQMIGSRCCI